ncbi:hypothetical protein ACEZ3G_03305 [Maribacter algicola]|uniref:Uncharacterized protein n=1 Tax=Meishania litoralis TaxID=3434685 RepID=A0ACC7LHM0_9FLAO
MRIFWFLVITFLFVSCDFEKSKEKKTRELVNQEMRDIDWNEVDNYPLFENCDELSNKSAQKDCFKNEVIKHFTTTLQEFEFVLNEGINATIYVDFIVDQEGNIEVLNIEKSRMIDLQMPEFDGIIVQGLKGLPEIAPALKRGVPVKSKYRIPIELNAK